MTRAEILDCLTDRPCDYCRFHESGRCERWNCVFEEKPDDAEDCEDAISRQKVLELVADYDLSMGQVVKGIHALPSVTPQPKMGRWIPISERLPEYGKKVLVTVNFFDDGAEVKISENDKYGFLCGNVLAWMPLPEPYEPQKSEEK